jgi:hypothetical protein
MDVMSTRAGRPGATSWWWVDAREPELQRLAHLLTGDLGQARARVVDALAAALTVQHADEADRDAAALHALVTAVASGHPPRAVPTSTAIEVVYDPDADDTVDERHQAVWDWMAGLSPIRRCALVLGRYRRLDEAQVAELIGTTSQHAADEIEEAILDAADLLGASGTDADEVVATTLRVWAATTPYSPTPVEAVRDGVRRLRGRRARISLVALAATGAATVVVALLGSSGPLTPARPSSGTPSPIANYEPDPEQVPPPWVLLPGNRTLRVELDTECSTDADEEFRSSTVIRARCRTIVRRR